MKTVVLASSSPFRQQILDKLQIPYQCHSPNIDETPLKGETAEKLTARLSLEKAVAVAKEYPDAIIIGSDQVAVLDGAIIGKPHTHPNAVAQLSAASGRHVRFLTGLTIFNASTQHSTTEVIPFDVHFRPLSTSMIENYLLAEQPYQCAGSFKSEGMGIALFEKLEGDDPNTLIGLPLIRTLRLLEEQGIHCI